MMNNRSKRSLRKLSDGDDRVDVKQVEPRRKFAFMKASPGQRRKSAASLEKSRAHARQLADFAPSIRDLHQDFQSGPDFDFPPSQNASTPTRPTRLNFANLDTESVFSGFDTVYDMDTFDEQSVYSNTSMFSSRRSISKQSPGVKYSTQQKPSDSFSNYSSPQNDNIFHPLNMKHRLGSMGNNHQQRDESEVGISPMNTVHTPQNRRYRSSPSNASVVSTTSSISGAAARRLMRRTAKNQQFGSNMSVASDAESYNSNWHDSPNVNEQQRHRRQSSSFTNHSTPQAINNGFTFDAFGLDEIQINNDVDQAIADLADSNPDISFFLNGEEDDISRISGESPHDIQYVKKHPSHKSSDTVSTSPLTASSFAGSVSRQIRHSSQESKFDRARRSVSDTSIEKESSSYKRSPPIPKQTPQRFMSTRTATPNGRRFIGSPPLKTIESVDLPDIDSDDSNREENEGGSRIEKKDFNRIDETRTISESNTSNRKSKETNEDESSESVDVVQFIPRKSQQTQMEALSASQLRAQEWRAARGDAPIIMSPLLVTNHEKTLKNKPTISQQRAQEWAGENPSSPIIKDVVKSYSHDDERKDPKIDKSLSKPTDDHQLSSRFPKTSPLGSFDEYEVQRKHKPPIIHPGMSQTPVVHQEKVNLRKIHQSNNQSDYDQYKSAAPTVFLRKVTDTAKKSTPSSSPTNFLESVKLKKTLLPAERIKKERGRKPDFFENSDNRLYLSESPSDESSLLRAKEKIRLKPDSNKEALVSQPDFGILNQMKGQNSTTKTESKIIPSSNPVEEMESLRLDNKKTHKPETAVEVGVNVQDSEEKPSMNKVAALFAQRAVESSRSKPQTKATVESDDDLFSSNDNEKLLSLFVQRSSAMNNTRQTENDSRQQSDVTGDSNNLNKGLVTDGKIALKNDPLYSKYFKMLKMGLPMEAVKHSMTRDGLNPDIMDRNHNLPAEADSSTGIPRKEDPRYQKYFKMLKIGLPIGAVKNAMERDGEDPSILDGDHNAPVKKQKADYSNDEHLPKDMFRRTRVHWNTIGEVKSTSVWALVNQDQDVKDIEIDESEFAELFQAELGQTAIPDSDTSKKRNAVKVIDPKRANNGGIVLARLKITYEEMAGAIDSINEKAMTVEQVQGILEYIPTKEEKSALRKYMTTSEKDSAEAFDDLCECEKFMVAMMTVKHSKEKVRALLFKLQFRQCVADMEKDVFIVEKACNELRNSVRLRKLLGIVLNIGNRLNTAGPTRKGKAGAFTIESLLKLNQAKAFDKKTTFLQYIIMVVKRHNMDLIDFKDDLQSVLKADKIYWDQIESDLEEVESQLENVRKIALHEVYGKKPSWMRRKMKKGNEDDISHESMTLEDEVQALRSTSIGIFTLQAIKIVSNLRENVEGTRTKFRKLLEYFGEDEKKKMHPHNLFEIICSFIKDFESAKDQVAELEKSKKRKEQKDDDGATHCSSKSSRDKNVGNDEIFKKIPLQASPSVGIKESFPTRDPPRDHRDNAPRPNAVNQDHNHLPSTNVKTQKKEEPTHNHPTHESFERSPLVDERKKSSSRSKREPIQMREITFKNKAVSNSQRLDHPVRKQSVSTSPYSVEHRNGQEDALQMTCNDQEPKENSRHGIRDEHQHFEAYQRASSSRANRPSPDSPSRLLHAEETTSLHETPGVNDVDSNYRPVDTSSRVLITNSTKTPDFDLRQRARAMRQERVKSNYTQSPSHKNKNVGSAIRNRRPPTPENTILLSNSLSQDGSQSALSAERERIASRRERLIRLQRERRRNS